MLPRLKEMLIGSISFSFYLINTLFWLLPLVCLSLLKGLIPIKTAQVVLNYLLDGCATNWITFNGLNQKLLGNTKIRVKGMDDLSTNEWYMVISNHQSWVDILILQRIFNRKIPFLKFFLKKELIWVPFMGIAWWALDFPFMKRYSKKFLQENPHMKGKDIETTQKACEKFQHKPVSVMNFVEGTRYTKSKHQHQQSTFQHLLKPKAGGVAFTLNAMNGQLKTLIDVTIHYPEGIPTFWQFISGQVREVQVQVSSQEISKEYIGDYSNDKAFQTTFQQWINELWINKDQDLSQMKNEVVND